MTNSTPPASDSATSRGDVYIDEISRIRVGALRTGPSTHDAAAQKRLSEIKAMKLYPAARKAKGGTWIAYLEDTTGYPHAYSDDVADEATAKAMAVSALNALNAL